MNTQKLLIAGTIAVVLLMVGLGVWYVARPAMPSLPSPADSSVTTFEECVQAGNPVMESYPRQCNTKDGKHFVETVATTTPPVTHDQIHLTSPLSGASVSSPLTITGEARGNWFFEASFSVYVTDWDGKIIGQGIATAQGDWMTTDFVPFTATITFATADISGHYSDKGTLILKKDNPSGLPEHDDALEIPIRLR